MLVTQQSGFCIAAHSERAQRLKLRLAGVGLTYLPRRILHAGELQTFALVGDVQKHASHHVVVRFGHVKLVPRTGARGGGRRKLAV